jgi:hypothetical protein
MAEYAFTLTLKGRDPLTDVHQDALFEAGCDDATFGGQHGEYFADFAREAASFGEAVGSAIRQVESAVPGLAVVRVERERQSAASLAAV